MVRLLFIVTLLAAMNVRAEFRTLRVRALASAGLRADASRLTYLTVTVVASDCTDDCSVFLSAEEIQMGKPTPDGDVVTTVKSTYGMITLSVVDLAPSGEVVLLCYEGGTRVRFAVYGVGERATPVTLLSGVANRAPSAMRLLEDGTMLGVTNHETGEFARYFLTLYGVRDGALKAIKAFEADKQTAFELKRFVREISPEVIGSFNTPNLKKAPEPSPTTVSSPVAQEPRQP
ncbi:MAG: hypothetical protein U1F61_24555 [Opitutaceae bacterium]